MARASADTVIGSIRPLKAAKASDSSPASIAFLIALWASLLFAILCLAALIIDSFLDGLPRLDSTLFTNYHSFLPARTGARAAIIGSLWLMAVTALLSLPLGVAAGAYLEEFADKTKWYNKLIEINISNLAAVPAIVYGMLTAGLCLAIGMERRIIFAGAIALTLVILPVIIIATREAIRAVPQEIRHGALALGATPIQTLRSQTLPAAIPGISTGAILALSRAFGEAAPLVMLGALFGMTRDPSGLNSAFSALPFQIFTWTGMSQEGYHQAASAAIIVMLVLLLMMNAVAILIRNKYQNRW